MFDRTSIGPVALLRSLRVPRLPRSVGVEVGWERRDRRLQLLHRARELLQSLLKSPATSLIRDRRATWVRSWSGGGRRRSFSRQALEVAERFARVPPRLTPCAVGLRRGPVSLCLKRRPYASAINQRPAVAQHLGQQNGIAPRGLERHELHVGLHALAKSPAQRLEGTRG